MRYPEAIDFLHRLQVFGARFGLDTARRLAALAGNPHEKLRFIHVAGTNGKGSTCAMLEAIYRHAGLRVGLFTSPHLVSFAERIQVNRTLIPEADVARQVEEMQPWLRTFPGDQHPTFFEVVTVMALRWFAEQRCDLVIWETGLGGRLDATNIVTPLASVITNIGRDHQQWLGDTLDQIAAEKAGIIKPGVPVVTAVEPGRGLEVIAAAAGRAGSPITVVKEIPPEPNPAGDEPSRAGSSFVSITDNVLTSPIPLTRLAPDLPLPGPHQRRNAALAVTTVRVLARDLPVPAQAMARGLATVQWPGRMQILPLPAGRTLVLDGAHNPEGAAALRVAFEERFPGQRPALVLGVLADKAWTDIVHELAPLAGRIVLVPVSSNRTLNPGTLQAACQTICPAVPALIQPTVRAALDNLADAPLVLVAGSLYLLGEVMEQLGLPAAHSMEERRLNEWTGPSGTGPSTNLR